MINHKGTRMVEVGEDLHGLQTNFKKFRLNFSRWTMCKAKVVGVNSFETRKGFDHFGLKPGMILSNLISNYIFLDETFRFLTVFMNILGHIESHQVMVFYKGKSSFEKLDSWLVGAMSHCMYSVKLCDV